MILNNYKIFDYFTRTVSVAQTITDSGIKSLSGSNLSIYFLSGITGGNIVGDTIKSLPIISDYLDAVFGSSIEPTSSDDYNVKSPLSNITIVSKSVNHIVNTSNKSTNAIFTFNIRNDNDESVEIKELGVVNTHFPPAYNKYSSIMLNREVLATPIEMEAGEVRTITVTWILN